MDNKIREDFEKFWSLDRNEECLIRFSGVGRPDDYMNASAQAAWEVYQDVSKNAAFMIAMIQISLDTKTTHLNACEIALSARDDQIESLQEQNKNLSNATVDLVSNIKDLQSEIDQLNNAGQWWLADIDQHGNAKLNDGAHSDRSGAEEAFSLFCKLGFNIEGRKLAVVQVNIFDPVGDESGINQNAVKTLNSIGLKPPTA